MDLLFEKTEGLFATEFKNALGFVDSDFKFPKLKPHIVSATNALVEIIGLPTYIIIRDAYVAGNKAPLVERAQTAICLQAYNYFSKINDLSHGPNGRKMRNDENQANPFEWMTIKADDEQQRLAYRAIDDLITYLDANEASWKQSDAYKATHKLLIRNTAEFDSYYTINSRLLFLKLSPGIAQCETRNIIPRIGDTIYQALKTKRKAGTDLTENEKLLLSHVQEACAYYALSWGLPRLQLTLFPDGVLYSTRSDRSSISARKAAEAMEVDSMSQKFQKDADYALREIEKTMAKHFAEELEAPTETSEEIKPFGFSADDTFVST